MALGYKTYSNQTLGFLAYRESLRALHAKLPDDMDVVALYTEAIMTSRCAPDGYHFYDARTGAALPDIRAASDLLRHCVDTSPHPFCRHLFIHITEPSRSFAGDSSSAADALMAQYRGTQAQHLQHMPAHTYLRTGRYHEAVVAGFLSIASDATFLSHERLPYGPAHNTAFQVYVACMSGERAVALRSADHLRSIYAAAPDRQDGPGPEQGWHIWRTTRLRFGAWSDVLSDSDKIPRNWPYARLLGHYAKGMALLGDPAHVDLAGARVYLSAVQNDTQNVVARYSGLVLVANFTLSSAIAHRSGETAGTVELLRRAVEEQTSWAYGGPPAWHLPMRQCLGEVLLGLRHAEDAVETFSADLVEFPENMYSLYGLREGMKLLPEKYPRSAVAEVTERLSNASQWAEIPVSSACLPFSNRTAISLWSQNINQEKHQ
ncbi:hypothetical protein CYMTET_29253 [Cymbomonas tetramitiformis]|uniref:Uncharacterized protein n=1 Tax=Cymbomonas tetramitiformis TaxID=36881 RepID=A0AAE0FL64_9CHLO|nr:hypothetical protein CYMTET_29253 [Cymbomonas tetramitiformis]|eukprot:gene5676-6861_t